MKAPKSTFSEARLIRITRTAVENEAIKLWDLMYVLADDDAYNEILFDLWEIYELNSEKKNMVSHRHYKEYEDISDSKRVRAGVWYWLLIRMAEITEETEFYFKKLRKRLILPIYRDVRGGFKKVEVGQERNWNCFVKLEDLKAFLKRIGNLYGLEISLPKLLFPAELSQRHAIPIEVEEVIRKAKPEIEIIYGYMKRKVGFSGRTPDPETKLKEEAEEVFFKKGDDFKLVEARHLEDKKLYVINSGQSKRDFIGALLRKIVKEKTGKDIGGQKLYERYKELTKTTSRN